MPCVYTWGELDKQKTSYRKDILYKKLRITKHAKDDPSAGLGIYVGKKDK